MGSEATVRVRPATLDDGQAIIHLHDRNGLGGMDVASWRSIWETYPFATEFQDVPIGWVIEAGDGSVGDGSVVGSLGNVPMLYDLAGRRIRTAIAASWVVDAAYRGKSLQLLNSFYKQKGIDLWLNGSANQVASQVLTALKMPRMPIPDYGSPCFWALRSQAFAKAVLLRRSTPAPALCSYPVGMLLLARDIALRSGRGSISSTIHRLLEFDERFDALWDAIREGPPRLRAVRTRAVLDWKFRAAVRSGRAAIVAAEREGKLLGYAVLVRREGSELAMDLYDVADIQASGDNQQVFRDLLLGSFKLARKEGADAVKFMSGTPAKRAPALALRPYMYHLPLWQLYYKLASPELGTALTSPDAWDFSLFDTY